MSESKQKVDISASEKLRSECCGSRLSFFGSWPEGSRGFDAATKQKVADAVGIDDTRAVSGGTRLYDARQPQIKEANALRGKISSFWRSLTLPLAQADVDSGSMEPGVRLVRRDQVGLLHAQMEQFLLDAARAEKALNDNREQVLAASQAMLGAKFNAKNYPEQWKIGFRWSFPDIDVPSYLEQLDPAAHRHQLSLVRGQFEKTFALATETMLTELLAVIGHLGESLGPIIRCYPSKTGELGKYYEAELVSHSELPEGGVQATLRYKPGGKGESVTEELVVPNLDALRPSPSTGEVRRFREGTVANVLDMCAQFKNLGAAMSAPEEVMEAISQAELALRGKQTGMTAGDIAKQLKAGPVFRESVAGVMTKIQETLSGQLLTLKTGKRSLSL